MSLPHRKLTPQEYLGVERAAEVKSEYLNGEMFAMSGANEWHELIKSNVSATVHGQFKGRPCKVYSSDMRVSVSATGLYTYPDVVALCGEARFEDDKRDTLLNPAVVFEVLSRTTEAYDRGAKFAHYRRVESIVEYVLIAQDRVSVEHFTRQPDGSWTFVERNGLDDVLDLPAVGARITLSDIYDRVDLSAVSGAPMAPRRPTRDVS